MPGQPSTSQPKAENGDAAGQHLPYSPPLRDQALDKIAQHTIQPRRQEMDGARSISTTSATLAESSSIDGESLPTLDRLHSFPHFRDNHPLWHRAQRALARVVELARSGTSPLRSSRFHTRSSNDDVLILINDDDDGDDVRPIRLPTPTPGVEAGPFPAPVFPPLGGGEGSASSPAAALPTSPSCSSPDLLSAPSDGSLIPQDSDLVANVKELCGLLAELCEALG